MNERIYELFFKAGGDRNTLHVLKLHTYFDPQEFAELIIKECAMHLHQRGVESFGIIEERHLKEHFGVE
jgi:hypothetical protein